MKEALITLNKDFQEDCIFDFAELECKVNRYNKFVLTHFTAEQICDGKPFNYIDYDDLEYHELDELRELFSSYISYKDYYLRESKNRELDEISNRSIDELEWYDHMLDCLNEESKYVHECKMNKIFNYIEQNY